MAEWVIPCNIKHYDVIGAFNKNKVLNWKQSTNIQVGDIVYIYVGAPLSALMFETKVKKVNLTRGTIPDEEFVKNGKNFEQYGRYMEIELLTKFDGHILKHKQLKENGLKAFQGPSRLGDEASMYIQKIKKSKDETGIFTVTQENLLDQKLIADINNHFNILSSENVVYYPIPQPFENSQKSKDMKSYPRNRKTAIRALARANYKCEINNSHPSFIRSNTNLNYTEPHHLIPLSNQGKYNNSLDIEANIVSLCSNCHNEIHYGEKKINLIRKLYKSRKKELEQAGLSIGEKELIKMYCESF